MKVLIVDDDELQRLFLQRLLRKNFQCEVYEGKNGLEGLSIVQKEHPDIVFLDVMMPIMDGKEMLESLRSDDTYRDTPVVVLSAANEKSLVTELIQLGVSDYLIKPISTHRACDRIGKIMSELRNKKQVKKVRPKDNVAGTKSSVLIIDSDRDFRAQLRSILSHRCVIAEADSGVEGLETFIELQPEYVCIGDNMRLPNEVALAKKIKALGQRKTVRTYLCTGSDELDELTRSEFDGVIVKQGDINELVNSVSLAIFGEKTRIPTLFAMHRETIQKGLEALAKQTLELITGQEVRLVEDVETIVSSEDVYIVEDFFERETRCRLSIGVAGSNKDVLHIAGIILKRSCTIHEDAVNAFSEVLTTIGKGIRTLLHKYGVEFDNGNSKVRINPYDRTKIDWSAFQTFQISEERELGIGIAVIGPEQ